MRFFKYFLLAGFSIAAAVWTTNGVAMSFFGKKQEVVIASPLSGVITYEGNPVIGAKVERWLRWHDEEGERISTVTDESGHFNLPLRVDQIKLTPLSRHIVHQRLTVYFQGNETVIWSLGTDNTVMYGELNGADSELICALDGEPKNIDVEHGLLYTLCKWN